MSNVKRVLEFIKPANLRLFAVFILTLFISFSILPIPHNSHAADQCTADKNGLPTDDFKIKISTLVSDIIVKVQTKLILTSQTMYTKFVTSIDFQKIIVAATALFVVVYGILFTSGMAQIKLYDFSMMLIKIGVVFSLFTASSWTFFNENVIDFFNKGTVELINYFTGTGNVTPAVANLPVTGAATENVAAATMAFQAIDGALSKVFSGDMFVVLMASSVSSKYGFIMAALIVLSIGLFLKSLMTAVWVYIMSLVMKTLLFGLAPVFIPMILFKRTRHLFDNWINQLVSASLQPILLFIFFVFFVKLMESSLDNILAHPVCWTKLPTDWRGSPMSWYFWQFAQYNSTDGWIPNENSFKEDFPIPLIHILTFLILAELANRFNTVVIQIAMQIAQASVSLAHEGTGMMNSLMGGMTRNRRIAAGSIESKD